MFLTDLINKPLFVSESPRGACLGAGISLKSGAIKYLLCAENLSARIPDFAVGVTAVENVARNGVYLTRLRPVLPKNCVRLFFGTPVYSHEGVFSGKIVEGEANDFKLLRLLTDNNFSFPLSSISACGDAIILKKTQPYPLGQRIPAPVISAFFDKNEPTVTRTVLKNAIGSRALIRLTLSLAPFSLHVL